MKFVLLSYNKTHAYGLKINFKSNPNVLKLYNEISMCPKTTDYWLKTTAFFLLAGNAKVLKIWVFEGSFYCFHTGNYYL